MATHPACRTRARPASNLAAVLVTFALTAAISVAAAAEELTLESAQDLALREQPLLEAQSAAAGAFQERAVSARQLPDPKFQSALNEIPANGADAWSLSRDGDTDFMVGFMQEFPRRAKRRLRGERAMSQAAEAESTLHDLEGRVRRDAGLAFLDAHHAEKVAQIGEQLVRESQLLREATELRLRSGLSTQAELLAASLETSLLADRVAAQRQASARARRQLARWIGAEASRPLAMTHRERAMPTLEAMLARLPDHPAVLTQARAGDIARAEVELARESYHPDWSLEIAYGYRPEFSEMVTIRAAIDLPIFRGKRQDPELAAARRNLASAEARREDRLRELSAQLAATHDDWRLLGARVQAFEREAVPQARARVEAATAAYRAGRGNLADSLAARRALLDVEMQALDIAIEREHRRVELEYFAP